MNFSIAFDLLYDQNYTSILNNDMDYFEYSVIYEDYDSYNYSKEFIELKNVINQISR
jgi:hypothetical protein